MPGKPVKRVTRVLDEGDRAARRPAVIRCDNGPKLTSRHSLAWGLEWKIELRHIQPSRPMQNGHMESFHGRLREECLRTPRFKDLFNVRSKITDWRQKYNEVSPHGSLSYSSPAKFARAAPPERRGKDAGVAGLEDASGVSHFATAPTAG